MPRARHHRAVRPRLPAARFLSLPLLAAVATLTPGSPAAARPAQEPPRVVKGTWFLTFDPASFRTVGDPVGRDAIECGARSCGAAYQFRDPNAASNELRLFVTFDATACAAVPCTLRAVPNENGFGFRGPVTFDGTTYRARGTGVYGSDPACARHLPKDTDTLTFTVGGPPDAPVLTGDMTALLAYVGPTGSDGDCTGISGYELYRGTITGRPGDPRTAFAGPPAGTPGAGGPGAGGSDASAGPVPRGAAPVAAARVADDVAARDHTRPVLSTRVATARDLPWRLPALAASALLALLLVLLMPFPAALFNATLEENYDTVRRWFRLGPRGAATRTPVTGTWPRFVLLVAGAGVLGAFLDPGLRADAASLVLVAGVALAAVVVSLLGALPARLYAGRRYGIRPHIALYPLGLAVAAACVVVSRLTSFEPGYLYGVVAGFGLARELRTDEKGRLTLATSAALLAVSGVAFALRVPVHDAVVRDGGLLLGLLDTVLAAVFAAGVEANVLGLLPLRFLPGEVVFRWSKVAWGALFGVNVFAFLHALSAAAGQATTGASVAVAATLFGAFATVSVTFWAYFRFRRPNPTPTSV